MIELRSLGLSVLPMIVVSSLCPKTFCQGDLGGSGQGMMDGQSENV